MLVFQCLNGDRRARPEFSVWSSIVSKTCLYLLDDDQKMRDCISKQAEVHSNLSVETFTKGDALIEADTTTSRKKNKHVF